MKLPVFRSPRQLLRDPHFRYGSVSTVLLCLCLAVLIALNALFTTLEKRNGWRVDYSFNAVATHSKSTLEVLEALPHPVHIYAMYEYGNEDLQLFELLNRYSAASSLITWEQAPISLNPGLLTRFAGATTDNTVTEDSLIVYCAQTNRFRVLSATDFLTLSIDYDSGSYQIANLTYESSITSAIAYVTQEKIPVVYIVQGHEELDANSSAALETLLLDNHYDVRYTTLASMSLTADDLLVFLSPVHDLTDQELAIITDFTAQGGSLLFTCDYADPIASMPNYQALLRAYGFLPLEGVVVEDKSNTGAYFQGNRTVLLPQMKPTDVTFDMLLDGTTTLILSGARAFQLPDEADASLVVAPMLQTSDSAHLRSLNSTSTSLERQEGDLTGPFALALEAYRFSGTGDVSRAVMIGSSALVTSEYYYAMSHAQEFIIRTMEYLVDSTASSLHIMARSAVRPALSANALTLGSILLVALPLSILGAALIILYPRRHM